MNPNLSCADTTRPRYTTLSVGLGSRCFSVWTSWKPDDGEEEGGPRACGVTGTGAGVGVGTAAADEAAAAAAGPEVARPNDEGGGDVSPAAEAAPLPPAAAEAAAAAAAARFRLAFNALFVSGFTAAPPSAAAAEAPDAGGVALLDSDSTGADGAETARVGGTGAGPNTARLCFSSF
jgi:hypothetical protein